MKEIREIIVTIVVIVMIVVAVVAVTIQAKMKIKGDKSLSSKNNLFSDKQEKLVQSLQLGLTALKIIEECDHCKSKLIKRTKSREE